MTESLAISVGDRAGTVSALLQRPADAWAVYVLAHGAGAGMRHRFMEDVAGRLAERGMATLRYQFPYTEAGRKRPDVPGVLHATVRAAVAEAAIVAPDLPRIAGGKSMGGRMTSGAQSHEPLPGVAGLAFLGFPLHPPGKRDTKRADHLDQVTVPMLFVQGTRDSLADLELLRPVCERLGDRASIHIVDGGDHSFKVLKRSGRRQDEVMDGLANAICDWARGVIATEVVHGERFVRVVDEARGRVAETDVAGIHQRITRGDPFILVDVREESEWRLGHIPGAIHIGKGVIERDVEGLIPDLDADVVLYCGGGYRSVLAAENLQKMGYTRVSSMDGGYRGWVAARHPVER